MESYLFVAGCLSLALGVIHSVMGEILIFRRMRQGRIIPTNGHPVLKERHVRILWASWHLTPNTQINHLSKTQFCFPCFQVLCWCSLVPKVNILDG